MNGKYSASPENSVSMTNDSRWPVYLLVTITSGISAGVSLIGASLTINAGVVYTSVLTSIVCFAFALILVFHRRGGLAFLLSIAIAPIVFGLVALYFESLSFQMPATRKAAESAFTALCKDVGVKLLAKPAAPVRSIAYDFDSNRISSWSASRVELDIDGRILGFGGFSKRSSVEATKAVTLEFTERRAGDGAGAATINPSAPYYHFPATSTRQPYYGVDKLNADILAFLDVDKPDEKRKAPVNQAAIRYQITLTDRRSGAILGIQTFVVDQVNNRACGANVDNVISLPAFIFDAISR